MTAVHGELKQNSDYNERWNLFTVSLLARAGALTWDFSLDEIPEDDDEQLDDSSWLTVRIAQANHKSDAFWATTVEEARRQMVERSGSSLQHLRQALDGLRCTGKTVAEATRSMNRSKRRRCASPRAAGPRAADEKVGSAGPRRRHRPAAITDLGGLPSRLEALSAPGTYGRRIAVGIELADLESGRKLKRLLSTLIGAGRMGWS